jgi:hypothetical protein
MQPRFAAASLVTTALLIACGSSTSVSDSGDGGLGNATAASCTPADAPRCGAAVRIASAEAFLVQQKQLSWQPVASSRTGMLLVSVDLTADADLVIDASTLAQAPKCASAPDGGAVPFGCGGVVFREDAFPRRNDTARVAGVGCAVPRLPVRRLWGELCTKLTIARGTTFRIRNVVLDDHPSGELQTVEILPACATPCPSGEARCGTTQVCLPLGYDTCAFCEGKSVATCACSNACGPRADGAECSYDSSPDTPVSGACSAGGCVTR